MALNAQTNDELWVDDGTKKNGYTFTIAKAPETVARSFSMRTRAWEQGDPTIPWRMSLGPWDGGLSTDRLTNQRVYAKANADTSFPGLLLFPPKLNALTFTSATTPPAMNVVGTARDVLVMGGRYEFKVAATNYAVTQDKDYGVGKAAVSQTVFNDELVVAMGETEKIWKRSTAGTWTQATDATYAIALGVVAQRLYRAESTNRISSCTTTPLTLTNWAPTGTNRFFVGDTTWPVHTIVDWGGVVAVGKGDGMYTADRNGYFKNQTPQLKAYPHANNCKGAFIAFGDLWVPSASGLIRMRQGESVVVGPEMTGRPNYRFWVRGGVEWAGAAYLLCTDEDETPENTFICKMVRDIQRVSGREYIFYEWCRFADTTKGYFIGLSTGPTNPTLYAGHGNNGEYIKMGRGGGRQIDDTQYTYGTSMALETGIMAPNQSMNTQSRLLSVTVVLNFDVGGEELTVDFRADGGAWVPMLLDQEQFGGDTISKTTNFQAVTLYAPFDDRAQGQFFEFRLTGALTATTTGTTRPEIREAWATGYSQSRITDIMSIGLVAGDNPTLANRGKSGDSAEEIARKWRNWRNRGTELLLRIPGYEHTHNTRFIVSDVKVSEVSSFLGAAKQVYPIQTVTVELVRLDHAGEYAKE